jgi:hypothetical protein
MTNMKNKGLGMIRNVPEDGIIPLRIRYGCCCRMPNDMPVLAFRKIFARREHTSFRGLLFLAFRLGSVSINGREMKKIPRWIARVGNGDRKFWLFVFRHHFWKRRARIPSETSFSAPSYELVFEE